MAQLATRPEHVETFLPAKVQSDEKVPRSAEMIEAAGQKAGKPRRRGRAARREAIAFYLFISPWLLGLLFFMVYPMLRSLYLSFTSYDLLSAPRLIGTENYAELLNDDLFWHSLEITLVYTLVSVPGSTVISIAVAMLLNAKVRAINYWRTIYYLPSIVSGVAMAVLWAYVFNPNFGLINTVLGWLGIPGPGWLTSSKWALPALIVMSWWQIGQPTVIYLAGLKGIPKELYEAAEIDGAGTWARFLHITIPMLSATIFFNLIIGIIGSFQVFTPALVMTDGGPANATLFYVLYLYRNAFKFFRMGYASSLAWVLFLIIIACTLLVLRSSSAWVYYESEPK
jgi:multiple sugar transport system permease protein